MCAYTLTMSICYNSEVRQNGAGMYPSRDITFNYRVSYARVKRTITLWYCTHGKVHKGQGLESNCIPESTHCYGCCYGYFALGKIFGGQIV